MRVAVVGAGIVGVTTAYELAADGHEVSVYERRPAVASETSFANAGVQAPGYVTPWAAPGMPWKVTKHLLSRHAPVRVGLGGMAANLGWLWRWWRACRPSVHNANRSAMIALARFSRERQVELTKLMQLDYEQRSGYLVLLRGVSELTQARGGLRLLAELGLGFELVDADRARRIEPALNPDTPLRAAVHLPHDGVGNCRQFAQLMKAEAQRLGAEFHLETDVLGVAPGAQPALRLARQERPFDAVVVAAGVDSAPLLRPLGVKLPLVPVWGYSVTAPLRQLDGVAAIGPQAALMDEKYKVAISRLGQRVRVAGSAELGGGPDDFNAGAIATLYKVLEDWFPGTAVQAQAQQWKGARPMLPDGPPVLGASGAPGVWLNLGHGSSGWASNACADA